MITCKEFKNMQMNYKDIKKKFLNKKNQRNLK